MKGKRLLRVAALGATREAVEQVRLHLDVPWLETWGFLADSPTLHEDLNFNGISALVAMADPGAPLQTLLRHLEATSHGDRPVVLVTDEARDAPWAHAFRMGIVELVPLRRLTEAVLRSSFLELERRPGLLRGNGSFNEFRQLFDSITRYGRTGVLELSLPNGTATLHLRWGRVLEAKGVALAPDGSPIVAENTPWLFREQAPPVTEAQREFEPLASDEPPLIDAVVDVAPVITSADVVPQQTSLLVVDDDPSVLKLMHDFFRHRGFDVRAAPGGPEALQALAAGHVDVTILDLDMPKVDGWMVLGAMREDVRTWDTQVLLFSAHDQYREVLARAGPTSHAAVPKTTRLTEVERHVRELMVPRVRVERRLASRSIDESITLEHLDRVGTGWLLLALERARVTGMLRGAATQAKYALWFSDGRLVQAQGVFEQGRCAGLDALRLVLASRPRSMVLEAGTVPVGEGFEGHPTGTVLSVVEQRLAIEQHHLGQLAVSQAVAVSVNEPLYHLYADVGSPLQRQIAQALCEQNVAPSDLSAHLGVAQDTITLVLRELVRRGVIQLSAALELA